MYKILCILCVCVCAFMGLDNKLVLFCFHFYR